MHDPSSAIAVTPRRSPSELAPAGQPTDPFQSAKGHTRTKHARPLTRRLPIVIAAIIALVATGIAWTAYVRIDETGVDAANARLSASAHDVSDMLQTVLRRAQHGVEPIAATPAVVAMFSHGTSADSVAAQHLLDSLRHRSAAVVAMALWDRAGRLRLVSGPRDAALASRPTVGAGAGDWGSLIGRLVPRGDTATYSVAAPSRVGAETIGYFVVTGRLADASSGPAIGKLVGQDVRLMLTNENGDVWSNLGSIVARPMHGPMPKPGAVYTATDARERIAGAARVGTTPWLVWLEAPLDATRAPAHRFLIDIIGIALIFVVIGGVAAWLIIRASTRPVLELTDAAKRLSHGEYALRVGVHSENELGVLAGAFNTMAERVQIATDELTARAHVLERRNRDLHESELRYRQLVDQSPDAIIVHRDGHILFASAVAARLVGADDPVTLIRRPLLDLVYEADRTEAERRLLGPGEPTGAASLTQLRFQRADGKDVVVEVSTVSVLFDGKPAVQTLARDVSERRQLEEQFRQSQKMEAVGRLAGGIAHDFNNLLTVIHTYAELALSATPEADERREDLEEIRRAAVSAARLTRQMLAFSRKQVLAPRKIDVNDAITGLTGMMQRVIGDNVKVSTDLRPNLGHIWADAGQLEQVLVNLAVNARDAMPKGGMLRIETANATLHEGYSSHEGYPIPAGDYILLAVSDSGIGMSREVQARIFEPFFTTKQPGQGTGLGLSTVYGIVRQSGGYIWVYSEPGQGTCFKIYFPRHVGEDAALVEPAKDPIVVTTHAAELLLVEDEPLVRGAVRKILEKAGYTITAVDSAPAAITEFATRHGRFDLVITDMVMPGMSGAELIRELRERNPELRAIIMSGYSEELTRHETVLPANAVYLEKPISPNDLMTCVNDLLGGGEPPVAQRALYQAPNPGGSRVQRV
jgi:two-component system, cell cycle sensor histidine kinase and response regulator CckA